MNMPERAMRPCLTIFSLFIQLALDVLGYESAPKAVSHARVTEARRRVAAPIFGPHLSESTSARPNGKNPSLQTAGLLSCKRASEDYGISSNQVTSSLFHPPTSGYLFSSPDPGQYNALFDAPGFVPLTRERVDTGENFRVLKKPRNDGHYSGFQDLGNYEKTFGLKGQETQSQIGDEANNMTHTIIGNTSLWNTEISSFVDSHYSSRDFDENQNMRNLPASDILGELTGELSSQMAADTVCRVARSEANTQRVTYAEQAQHGWESWPDSFMEGMDLEKYESSVSMPNTEVRKEWFASRASPAIECPNFENQTARKQLDLSNGLVTFEQMASYLAKFSTPETQPFGVPITGSSSKFDVPFGNHTPHAVQSTESTASHQNTIPLQFGKSARLENYAPTFSLSEAQENGRLLPASSLLKVSVPPKEDEHPPTSSSEVFLTSEKGSGEVPCKNEGKEAFSPQSSPDEDAGLECQFVRADPLPRAQPPGDTPDGELRMSNASIKVYAWIGATYDRNEMRYSASMYHYLASFTTQLKFAQQKFVIQCGKRCLLHTNWLSKTLERNRYIVKKIESFVRHLWFLNKYFLEALGTRAMDLSYEREQKLLLDWLLNSLLDPKRGYPLLVIGTNEFRFNVQHVGELENCLRRFIELDENPNLWTYSTVKRGRKCVAVNISKEAAATAELAVHVLGSYCKETNYRKWRAVFPKDNDYLEFLVTLGSNYHRGYFSDSMEKKINSMDNTSLLPWAESISDQEWKDKHDIIQTVFKEYFEEGTTAHVQFWVEG